MEEATVGVGWAKPFKVFSNQRKLNLRGGVGQTFHGILQ